ncbi:MAG: hypothetical protein HC877_02350 [Thioploca sp.]|nr:hypothetical protein [Thioploca sp.]
MKKSWFRMGKQFFLNYNHSAEPTYLVVYRDRNDKVGFMQLNQVSAYLLQTLRNTAYTGQQILTEIATQLNHPHPQTVIQGGLETLQEWLKRDIVLGTCSK